MFPPAVRRSTACARTPALLLGIALVELGLQQGTQVGGARALAALFAGQLLHRVGLLRHVLGLDRQVDRAVLAVDVDDHRLDRVAFLEVAAQVFDAIARELGGAQVAFDFRRQSRSPRPWRRPT